MRVFAVFLLGAVSFVTSEARAQQLGGRVVVGLETPFFRLERATVEPGDSGAFEFDYRYREATARSTVSLGLASNAHGNYPFGGPLLVVAQLGYAFADAFMVGLHVGAGFASSSGGGSAGAEYWSLAVGPRAEYLFGCGWIRPFAGLELGLLLSETGGNGAPRVEQSGRLWSIGPTGGVYLFASDVLAFDLRASLGYGAGSLTQEVWFVTPALVEGDLGFEESARREDDVEQLNAVIALGLSAWL